MPKQNLFTKKLKKQFLSINDSIESYFNKIRYLKSNYKKFELIKNYKAFLIIGIIFILIISYFLLPIFYNKNLIKAQIENQISKKYNIDIKINNKLSYGLFPKPHFITNNSTIFRKNNDIAQIKKFKIFISINNFFKINNLEVKDLLLKKTEFSINKDDLIFFVNLLNTEPNENKIVIKDSRLFFKGNNQELLFINKIKKHQFYYNSKNLFNGLLSYNEIFNTPFKLVIENDKFNKKIYSKFRSKKIRLSIENIIKYDDKIKDGSINITLINKVISFDYQISNNSLIFKSDDIKNNFQGQMDFKPFYLYANFNYDGLSPKKVFSYDSIIFDLIKSEIFSNSNLNINLNLNVKDIVNIDELKNLKLKIAIEEGNIDLSDSSINWKNDLKIYLKDGLISYNNESINLVGKVNLQIKDLDNFYRSFQIKKDLRKKITEIQFDINYNFTSKDVSFYNVRIDNKLDTNLENFINKFNSQKDRGFNKITFKNFIRKFFKAYSG
ncbi:hypothetical protein IDH21_01420 [Pelagibacterales bacterium SAG-MED47]|nr:hypothetical protein [Pelagibacterales bacterium SAG-MED47]